MKRIIHAAALFAAAAGHAAERPDRRIAALAADATALKAKGDGSHALERAREALALAEKAPGPRSENLYVALAALGPVLPEPDFAQQFEIYERLSAVAATARGADSFVALEALASRNILAFVLRKPGGTLAAFADPVARATPLARTDAERTRITGLTLALAQFYDATGEHAKAVEIVARVAAFYDRVPDTPNLDYVPGLTSLGRRYIAWQDWPAAIDAADRAIAASTTFLGARTFRIAQPLDVRGVALTELGRIDEAEAAYREAAVLASGQPDVGITVNALSGLARLYTATGRDALAEPLLLRVAALAETGPARSNARMVSLLELYNIARRAGDDAAALRYALDARADADARGLGGNVSYLRILLAVANGSIDRADPAAAAAALTAAEALLAKIATPNSSTHADIALAQGRLAILRNDHPAAIAHIRAALARWDQRKGGDPQHVAATRALLARELARSNDRFGAYAAGREGAVQMTRIILDRAGRGNANLLDPQSATVFGTAIDTAWATQRR